MWRCDPVQGMCFKIVLIVLALSKLRKGLGTIVGVAQYREKT